MSDDDKEEMLIATNNVKEAIHYVMMKVGVVKKDGHNDFQNYDYVTEASLLKDLRPAMIEAGLILIPSGKTISPIDEHGNIFVEIEYTVAHVNHKDEMKVTAYGCGNDRNSKGGVGDKGLYKALTGANKYLLFKLFQIATQDDPEKTSHEGGAENVKDRNIPTVYHPQNEPTVTIIKKSNDNVGWILTDETIPKEYWDSRDQSLIGGKGHTARRNDNGVWVIAKRDDVPF